MSERNLLRELDFLLSDIQYLNITDEFVETCKTVVLDKTKKYPKYYISICRNMLTVVDLMTKLGLSKESLSLRYSTISKSRRLSKQIYKLKPQKEGRDNKGVYVGGGGSNRNKIRYPSQKRSKRTWRIFYEMFPMAAERDGWDGNKSNKMK
jgi:hypothetical protein